MTFSPVFENEALDEVKKYYDDLKKAFEVKTLPLFFYLSGNFPEFLRIIIPSILANLKSTAFPELVSETRDYLLALFGSYKPSRKFDAIFRESAKVYKENIDFLFMINLKLLIFLYAIRESIKGMALGLKKLPEFTPKSAGKIYKIKEGSLKISPSYQKQILEERVMEIDLKVVSLSKTASSLPVLTFYDFLKQAEELFKNEVKDERFVLYRLGAEKILLNSLSFLPEKLEIDYKRLLESLEKYKDYHKFIPLLAEDFPVVYLHKLLLLLFLKQLAGDGESTD